MKLVGKLRIRNLSLLMKFIQRQSTFATDVFRTYLFTSRTTKSKKRSFKRPKKGWGKVSQNQLDIIESNTFEKLIAGNRYMTPASKGLAGMIVFKLSNDLPLDSKEEQFYSDLQTFLKTS